ncbi:MAG: type II toxin-antitoxin system RelE/ParE family toxin [Oceanicaulis sp.]
MSRWRLTTQAGDDLKEIGRSTALFWGVVQAQAYLTDLYSAFDRLADFPEAGARRAGIDDAVRARPSGSHTIFYRIRDGRVEILRILHGHADAPAAFRKS